MAEENLTLFLHCFNKGHDALQVYAVHILSDILTTHGPPLLSLPVFENGKPLYKMFSKALRADDKPEVQAAACTAVCKLMLGCIIKDEDLLKLLVVAYFDPGTSTNLGLRQALSYFLPVYCHSRRENQERMQRVNVAAIHSLMLVNDNVDEEEEMVGTTVIASQLVDWTDPRKLVVAGSAAGESLFDEMGKRDAAKAVNGDVHLNLATDLLEKIGSSSCNSKFQASCSQSISTDQPLICMTEEEKKLFAGMLGKLYVTSNADQEKLRAVHDLVSEVIEDRLVSDAPSRNGLNRLQTALWKVVGEAAQKDAVEVEAEDSTGVDADKDSGAVADDDGGAADETVNVEETGMEDVTLKVKGEEPTKVEGPEKDSLLDELLDDEDDV